MHAHNHYNIMKKITKFNKIWQLTKAFKFYRKCRPRKSWECQSSNRSLHAQSKSNCHWKNCFADYHHPILPLLLLFWCIQRQMEIYDLQQVFPRKSHGKKPISLHKNRSRKNSQKISTEAHRNQKEKGTRSVGGKFCWEQIQMLSMLSM